MGGYERQNGRQVAGEHHPPHRIEAGFEAAEPLIHLGPQIAQIAIDPVKALQRLTLACLSRRGTPGERALNEYIDAANAWGGCLADAACSTTSIEPVLQSRWRVASRYLAEARSPRAPPATVDGSR